MKVTALQSDWSGVLKKIPDFPGKAYYTWEYLEMLQNNGEGKAMALLFEENHAVVGFYPFLLKKIPDRFCQEKTLFDIETPYGYGGIWANPDHVNKVYAAHHDWCRNNHIVAEFVRLNPLVNQFFSDTLSQNFSHNRTTVSIELTGNFNMIIQQASVMRQRNFRRACRAGLSFRPCSRDEFVHLYLQTMKLLGAELYYFFSNAYFENLFNLSDSCFTARAVFTADNRLAAAAVFLEDSIGTHYHLGASDRSFFSLRPNDFLIFKAAEESLHRGKKVLHLGGGLTDNSDDRLYAFKRGFSPSTHSFQIGRFIHQPEIYSAISRRWQQETGDQPQIHLHYHQEKKHEII
ncbi:MAG: GNAT family N-acetyltransferase [Candidatus Rifleibacteriota bacterium]